MKNIIFLSTSLSNQSKSSLLIDYAMSTTDKSKYLSTHIDLKHIEMPFCDGRSLDDYSEQIKKIYFQINNADFLVLGFPIYCYSISGVFKNFLDIFSKAMTNKPYGICCALGSNRSFLAISDLQKILFFQSNAKLVYPTVVCDYTSFETTNINNETKLRIDSMMTSLLSMTKNS